MTLTYLARVSEDPSNTAAAERSQHPLHQLSPHLRPHQKRAPVLRRATTDKWGTAFLSGFEARMSELVTVHNLWWRIKTFLRSIGLQGNTRRTVAPRGCKCFRSELFPDAMPPIRPMAVTMDTDMFMKPPPIRLYCKVTVGHGECRTSCTVVQGKKTHDTISTRYFDREVTRFEPRHRSISSIPCPRKI